MLFEFFRKELENSLIHIQYIMVIYRFCFLMWSTSFLQLFSNLLTMILSQYFCATNLELMKHMILNCNHCLVKASHIIISIKQIITITRTINFLPAFSFFLNDHMQLRFLHTKVYVSYFVDIPTLVKTTW